MTELSWMERREFTLRAAGGDRVKGHAAVYDCLSEDLGGFREVIRPGAFKDVLKDDVRALINHDANLLLARTKARTLRLSDDGHGLAFEFELSEATYAQDLRIAMARGDIDQCSFAFDVALDRWNLNSKPILREVLLFKKLWDISVVVYPAYPGTDAGLRERAQWDLEVRRRRLELLLVSQGERA